MRNVAVVLTLVLGAAFSGCGGTSGNDKEAGQPDSSVATPDPKVKAAESLSSVLASNSTGEVGFTSGQADCVAKGFVEQFGVDGLQGMGLLDEDLGPGNPSGGFDLSPVEASAAADATLACVNAEDFITNLMSSSGGSGGFDDATVDCMAEQLGDNGTHDLLVAAFQGDQRGLQEELMPAAMTCAMG